MKFEELRKNGGKIMNDREISVLKLDILFKIFGIRVTDHEENIIVNEPPLTFGCYAFSPYRKDIEITILKKREEWFHPTPYDMNEIFEEVVRILEDVDNHDMFYISSERWATLDNRRAFVQTLERRANKFLKQCRYLPDFSRFTIEEFSGEFDCAHRIRIFMKNGIALPYTMNNKELGQGYYGRLVFVLLRLFEDALKVQKEIDKEKQEKAELIRMIMKIKINSIYGLPGDFDGDTCVIMHRGRGLSKSLSQLKLDTLRYLYDFSAMKDCTTAMVQYCKADADAAMRAYLAMKENNKHVVLEQLEMEDPLVPMKQFESLVTGSPNGEAEILIDVNKEDKTMMIPVIRRPQIKKVIFNDPATIVFWEDGSKTVVKCEKGEKFDPEKGVAIALAKKVLYSKDYSRIIASSEDVKKITAKKKSRR